jgi:hypothetical protein
MRTARGLSAAPLDVRRSSVITSSDREYKATKRIKQGKSQLAPPFDELAAWISSTWHVTVLNAIYDRANDLHAPRLQVILDENYESNWYYYYK